MGRLSSKAVAALAAIGLILVVHGTALAGCQIRGRGTVYACQVTCTTSCPTVTNCNGGGCVFCGSAGADVINGTAYGDIICGEGGDDTIDGNGGADTIDAGEGNNIVNGGTGADYLYGSNGDDIIYGGDSGDTIVGGGGSDALYGDSGDDNISQGVPVYRQQPAAFTVNSDNDFSYRYQYTASGSLNSMTCTASATVSVCGTNATAQVCDSGAGANSLAYVLNDSSRGNPYRLVLQPSNATYLTTLIEVPATVTFTAPADGKYAFDGSFRREGGCGSSGDGVNVDVWHSVSGSLYSSSIGTSDFSDHTFNIAATYMKAGETASFRAKPGASADYTNDATELEVSVTPYDLAGTHTISEDYSSTLCGGSGSDTLSAKGPGRQCMDGGTTSGDSCTGITFAVPSLSDRDAVTATAACETESGTNSRSPGCGCN